MTVAGGGTSAAYDAFAPYYDAFTSASDYEAWGRETLAHARGHGLRGERLLDLACGTGMSFMPFLARGFDVTACDFSTAMLAEAARRAPAARVVHADIRALPDLGSFDLLTCFDDALNYLLGEDELGAAFAGMKRSLAQGGVAIFDLNSLLAHHDGHARGRPGRGRLPGVRRRRRALRARDQSRAARRPRAFGPTHASGPRARDVVACQRKAAPPPDSPRPSFRPRSNVCSLTDDQISAPATRPRPGAWHRRWSFGAAPRYPPSAAPMTGG